MKIYITGVSGVGKTSVIKALSKTGMHGVDVDELSHWENILSGATVDWAPGMSDEWRQTHVWICDIAALKKELASAPNVAVAGNTANQNEFLSFFDKMFVLHCSPETIVSRINSRTDNDYGKHPQERQHILEWQKTYDAKMVARGAIQLDADQPLEQVLSDIRRYTGF